MPTKPRRRRGELDGVEIVRVGRKAAPRNWKLANRRPKTTRALPTTLLAFMAELFRSTDPRTLFKPRIAQA
jgi:hypothetical protein